MVGLKISWCLQHFDSTACVDFGSELQHNLKSNDQ